MKRRDLAVVALIAIATIAIAFLTLSPSGVSNTFAQANVHAAFASVASQQFRLIDSTGRWRGEMFVDARGPAVITLTDTNGREALRLGVDQNGTPFIQDARGRPLLAAKAQHRQDLPPVQRVSPPGQSLGKADAADEANVNAIRDELNAVWRQLRILLDRVDQISRGS